MTLKKFFASFFIYSILFTATSNISFAESGYINAGSLKVHYVSSGKGKPLVFLHAGYQDYRMWDKQAAFFDEYYRVITFDLPGQGLTQGTDTTLLIQDVLRICLDSLHISKASFAGLSLGSVSVTDFVLAYPGMVDKVILISPGLTGSESSIPIDTLTKKQFDLLDTMYVSGNKDSIAKYFTKVWCIGPFRKNEEVNLAVVNYIYNTTLRTLQNRKSDSDWPHFNKQSSASRMHLLGIPLLIIAGDKDVPFIVAIAEWIHKTVNGSRLVIFNGAAHMLNLEQPDLFNKTVYSFLKE